MVSLCASSFVSFTSTCERDAEKFQAHLKQCSRATKVLPDRCKLRVLAEGDGNDSSTLKPNL